MVGLNWNNFRAKFNGKETKAFENLSYRLFCDEFKKPNGIFRFKNQVGIETEPIKIGNDFIAFQAKFYEASLSTKKNDLISSILKAKEKNPKLTKIIFYLNQEFSESSISSIKDPQYKIEIEVAARLKEVAIEWRVPSHLEMQILSVENRVLAYEFFGKDDNKEFSSEQILQKFKNASFFLENVIGEFEGLKNSHLERVEKDQLIKWVNTPLKPEEKGIVLLVGNAGPWKKCYPTRCLFTIKKGENSSARNKSG